MIWTHIYDLILKLVTLFLSIIIMIQFPFSQDYDVISILIGVILFFVSYHYFIRTLATYLYCKLTLKMNVSFSQAKQLNNAFSPVFSLHMQWLPMTEIKPLDDSIKYEVALATYLKWEEDKKRERKQNVQDFKNAGQRTKILTVIMYVLVGYFMIAGFMNLPPANYLTLAYCKLFDTDKYYPILNCFLLALPTILIFKAIDKNIK
jgi:hypothetical protein